LHREHIAGLTRFEVSEEIGDAITIPTPLTGDVKSSQFCATLRVEHHHRVVIATTREIAVCNGWMKELVFFGARQPFLEDWLCLVSEILFVLLTALVFGFAHLPLTSEESLSVEERNHFVERNLLFSLED
jgi:hypothetical protein